MKYYDNLDVTGEICTGGKIVATKEYVDGLISGESGGLKGCIEALDTKLSEHTADFVKHEEDFAKFKGENDAKIAELVAKDEELTGKLDNVEEHVQSEANPHKTTLKQVLDEGSIAEFGDTGEQYSPDIKIQVADYNRAKNDYVFQVNPEILKIASGCAGIEFSDGVITATGVIYGCTEPDTRKTNALTTISLVNDIVGEKIEKVKNDLNEKINEVVSSKVKVKVLTAGEDLPTQGDSLTIYFKPAKLDGKDLYEEYMWLEQSSRYELLGNTEIALADYVTNEKFDKKTEEIAKSISDLSDTTTKYVDDAKEDAIDQAKVYTNCTQEIITKAYTDLVSAAKVEVNKYTDGCVSAAIKYTDGCVLASEKKTKDDYTKYVDACVKDAKGCITEDYQSYVKTCVESVDGKVGELGCTVFNLGCAHEVNAAQIVGLKSVDDSQEKRIQELYSILIDGTIQSDINELKINIELLDTSISKNSDKIESNAEEIEKNVKNIDGNTKRIEVLESYAANVDSTTKNATNATELVLEGKDYKIIQVYQVVNDTKRLVVADVIIDDANNKTRIAFASALSGMFEIHFVK